MRLHPHPRGVTLLLVCIASSLWAVPTRAEPILRVRAAARMQLHVSLAGDHPRVEGSLSDDLGAAIAEGEIRVRIDASDGTGSDTRIVRTDAAGSFEIELPPGTQRCAVHASYDGDEFHERSEAVADIDLALADVTLRILLQDGPTLHLEAEPANVEVRADSAVGAEGLHVELGDELGRVLARGATDSHGVFRTLLTPTRAGAAGAGKLTAASAVDARRAAAHVELSILRKLDTHLDLFARWAPGSTDVVLVHGSLLGPQGANDTLAHKAVGVFVDGAHAATLLTDAQGRLAGRLSLGEALERSGHGLAISARFEPDAPWLGASASRPLHLEWPGDTDTNPSWLALPVVLSIAIALWLARRSRPASVDAPPQRASLPGVQAGPPQKRGSPRLSVVMGQVRDATSGLPLTAAEVTLIAANSGLFRVEIDGDGVFRSTPLPPGEYALEISAAGYAGERTSLSIPHTGEASSLRVALVSLRVLALDALDPIVARVLPTRGAARVATARETLGHARRRHLETPALEQLALRIEHTAFAQDTPTPDDIVAISAQAASVTAALDSTPEPAVPPTTPRWER